MPSFFHSVSSERAIYRAAKNSATMLKRNMNYMSNRLPTEKVARANLWSTINPTQNHVNAAVFSFIPCCSVIAWNHVQVHQIAILRLFRIVFSSNAWPHWAIQLLLSPPTSSVRNQHVIYARNSAIKCGIRLIPFGKYGNRTTHFRILSSVFSNNISHVWLLLACFWIH